ncbi:hypothetical protein A2781_03295 [Candidatus Gottesmanbacteria bacterium RIFCSPHIGHO2_01_FULL_42_27]|nr:MAG: hypothetical protein A2781_03295 [Candidatus Gottesmanbacteria bacterium RIFCSPHIGHO2_01_FULL_42_27]
MKMKFRLIYVVLILLLLNVFSQINPIFAESDWNIYRVSSINAIPSYPQLSSSNLGFGIVWVDNRESDLDLFYSRINSTGKRQGNEIKLTDNEVHDETPALVWNGKDFALFWSQNRSQIYFTRFRENGRKIIGDKSLDVQSNGYAIHVSAVWNGEEFGVVWWDVRDAPQCTPSGTRGRAFFARVNNQGEMIGEEIPVSDKYSNPWQDYKPFIVWDGENYAIFWNDSREGGECTGGVGDSEIFMSKVNSNGEKILGDIKLQSNELSPQLWDVEWDGENYVIGYNGRIAQGHLAKMDSNGNTILVDVPINSGNQGGSPTITSKEDKYYIAWSDFRVRTPETFYNTEIYYTEADKDGNKLIPETRLTFYDQSSSEQTPIKFYKENMGIAWIDSKDGNPQVYFASNLHSRPKLFPLQKPAIPSISFPRPILPFR